MLVKKRRKANESATSLSNEQLHHGVFLKFLSTFRKYACHSAECLDPEIVTEYVKNAVGEDVPIFASFLKQ